MPADAMDAYAEPLERDIEAKSESWLATQGRAMREGFSTAGREAWRDIGNTYQSMLWQDAGFHAQWNARGVHSELGQADTTVYVGLSETNIDQTSNDTTVYVGLSDDDIGRQQAEAETQKLIGPPEPDKSGPEPEFYV
jgi:hypothetical protein